MLAISMNEVAMPDAWEDIASLPALDVHTWPMTPEADALWCHVNALYLQQISSWQEQQLCTSSFHAPFIPAIEGLQTYDAETLPSSSSSDSEWLEPKKLLEGKSSSGTMPMSLLTSPILVPLPKPMSVDGDDFAVEALALPTSNAASIVLEEAGLCDRPSADLKKGPIVAEVCTDAETPMRSTPKFALEPPPGLLLPSDEAAPPGITISRIEVDHHLCTRIEWQLDDFRGRLLSSMNRPLVSPSFAACGLSNLRLMVFPDAHGIVKNARSHERKTLHAHMVKKGPFNAALKLKADCLDRATVVRMNLTVGNHRIGTFRCDFSEQAIQGVDDAGLDWLKQIDLTGGLRVGLEILEVQQ